MNFSNLPLKSGLGFKSQPKAKNGNETNLHNTRKFI